MKKIKCEWHYNEMYRQNYYLLKNAGPDELRSFVKDQFGYEECFLGAWAGKCVKVFNSEGEMRIVIAIRNWDTTSYESLGVLHHEINHAAMFTLEERGVFVSTEHHEAFNYLSMSLFEVFVKKNLKRRST